MFSLGKIAEAMGGRLVGADPARPVPAVSTDSRAVAEGQLFFALTGPRFNGHAFIERALGQGACAAVVQTEPVRPVPAIVVEDTRRALGDLAAAWRRTLAGPVVAVTGTNGKTTTKEMIAHLAAGGRSVVKAPLSYNNDVGLPMTLLSAPETAGCVVLEAGINHPGEMARLASIANPDVAVITNVSEGHLAGLRSAAGVAREKGALLGGLREGGTAILNADNPWTAEMARGRDAVTFGIHSACTLRARAVHPRGTWFGFIVEDVPFKVRSPNLCNVYNALAAVAAARALGVSLEECAARLIEFEPPAMRMERQRIDGVTFINDAYNANPASMRAAVAAFSRMRSEGRRVAVLGDMRELGGDGPRLHQEVARFTAGLGLDLILAVGDEMGHAAQFFQGRVAWAPCRDASEAAPFLRAVTRTGDLILLKGSRAMGLERIVEHFRHA